MEYRELVDVYERLDATASSLEKTEILAALFRDADAALLPRLVLLARGQLFAAWESHELGVSTNLTVDAVERATGVDADRITAWWRDTGDLGDAAARAVESRRQATLRTETLTVTDVHDSLRSLADVEGEGSQDRRVAEIARLVSNAGPTEARYVVRTVVGAMRLGVGRGTIRDAIAAAFLDGSDEASDAVEHGLQVTNDARVVAETARDEGLVGVRALEVELFRPIEVMLALNADGLEAGLDTVAQRREDTLLEYKYDGVRTQIHHDSDRTAVYTRRLEDVTDQFPEVAEAAPEAFQADAFVLEGEIVGYDPEMGDPVPFQELSRRVKRKYDIAELREKIPVTVHAFDILYLDDGSLLDVPLRDRVDALERRLDDDPTVERAANCRAPSPADAAAFYEAGLSAGHEGVMVKNLAATYQPGERVGYQLKVKPTMEPLDLVVTRARWSEGRRSDFLGRVYLACRGPDGELLEVGRMATGFTDAELVELTDRLEPLVTSTEDRDVVLTPEVVLKVEYEEIQESPEYDSGYALRFPRFVDFRDELEPADADSLERVAALYDSQSPS